MKSAVRGVHPAAAVLWQNTGWNGLRNEEEKALVARVDIESTQRATRPRCQSGKPADLQRMDHNKEYNVRASQVEVNKYTASRDRTGGGHCVLQIAHAPTCRTLDTGPEGEEDGR